jgi:mxaA protein
MTLPTSAVRKGRAPNAQASPVSAAITTGLRLTVTAGILFAQPVLAAQPPSTQPASTQPAPTGPAPTQPPVEQPRPTGYFVGDRVTQRILLERDGRVLRPAALPRAGRVSTWFERHRATIETDTASRHWLVVEYQILNAPPKLTIVTLPEWVLPIEAAGLGHDTPQALRATVQASTDQVRHDATQSRSGADQVRRDAAQTPHHSAGPDSALKIPAASISIAPLSLPGSPAQVGTADLRPDHLPRVIATAPLRRAMLLSAGALVLTLSGWLGWLIWRNRRAAATQPFAHALREMRTLDDHEPRAWQTLHRAFDSAAGRVIHTATLPALFERAPELIPARARIEQFYVQSSLLFFGAPSLAEGAPQMAGSTTIDRILPRALCLELRRIEKRHER